MLTEASIRRVLYYPEELPDTAVIANIAAGSEASPPQLDLRQFPPLLLRMVDVTPDQDDDVEMRFKVDDTTLNTLSGSMFDPSQQPWHPNNFSLLAKKRLHYNLYNGAVGAKTNYKSIFSLWVIKPTVAHKLRYGITLTPDEQKLNKDLGIAATVEKGLLPLPLKEQISREFQVLQEETHGFQLAVPTAGITVKTLHPAKNQFLVLTKISADPGTAATDVIQVAVDRDYVPDYVVFPTWALGITGAVALDKELNCFIPALNEIRIRLNATVARTINIRFTILKCAMTNLFRAR
ncbi:hypothetical protein ES705_40057 [subsurface metagenome]